MEKGVAGTHVCFVCYDGGRGSKSERNPANAAAIELIHLIELGLASSDDYMSKATETTI
ncbi:MAG: hypothetical protein KatS3mg060_2724 [Dehalococcoidia bacterium]|nr:MAG: hypothetical protein KatS3mg060_2724 [Dehalococcoidia bacterium]